MEKKITYAYGTCDQAEIIIDMDEIADGWEDAKDDFCNYEDYEFDAIDYEIRRQIAKKHGKSVARYARITILSAELMGD